MAISETVNIINQQVSQSLLKSWTNGNRKHNPKRFKRVAIDDLTLRFNKGKTNVDVKYNVGLDLYDVTVHKTNKNWETKSKTTKGMYFDQLINFF